MITKYLFLVCALVLFSACSNTELDLGPVNEDYGKEVPVEEPEDIEYDFVFESEEELTLWSSDNSSAIESVLSLHGQSTALQIAPTLLTDGWGLNAAGESESSVIATVSTLVEPRALQGGRAVISVFMPSFYTLSNPWDTSRNDRNSVGFEIFLQDASDATANIFGWENADNLGKYLRGPRAREDGNWFDFDIDLGAVSGLDMTQINGIGLRLTLTDRCLDGTGTDHCDTTEVSTNEQYVFIDSVALIPPADGYVPPVVPDYTGAPTKFALPIYADVIADEWTDLGFDSTGWHYLTDVDWAGTDRVYVGGNSATIVQQEGGVWKFGQETGVDLSEYSEFQFKAYTQDSATFAVVVNGDWDNAYITSPTEADKWNTVIVPMSSFVGVDELQTIEVQINGVTYPYTYYVDDLGFDAETELLMTVFSLPIFTDAISSEWVGAGFDSTGWHWNTTVDWAAVVNVKSGTNSATVVQEEGGVWKFGQDAPGFDLSSYSEFQFSVYAADAVTFTIVVNGDWASSYTTAAVAAGEWTTLTVPMSSLAADLTAIASIEVQAGGAPAYPYTYYLDDIGFDGSLVPVVADFTLPIYLDAIASEWTAAGFDSTGWHYLTSVDWAGVENVSTGTNSGTVVQDTGGVWKFGQAAPGYDLSSLTSFQFSAFASDSVTFTVVINGDWVNSYTTEAVTAGEWSTLTVPMSAFGLDLTTVETIEVQAGGAPAYPYTYYIDDIGFD